MHAACAVSIAAGMPCLPCASSSCSKRHPCLSTSPPKQAFAAAAAALPATEDTQAMQAAAAALDALLPLDADLADLASLQAALAALQAAGTTDSYVPDAVADLAAVRAVALEVGDIAATLRALQGDYATAEPCMAALLERAAAINATCLTLPAGLAADVALLASARDALAALMESPGSSPAALADTLDASLPLPTIDAALEQLATAVSLRETIAGADLPTAMDDLQAVAASLNASSGQLEAASDGLTAYLAMFPAGGAPQAAWAAAAALVQAAGVEVGAAAAQVPADTTVIDQASGREGDGEGGAAPACPVLCSAGQATTHTRRASPAFSHTRRRPRCWRCCPTCTLRWRGRRA